MPIIYKNIICDDKKNPKFGEEITIRRYTFNGTNKPLGVIYGCFSPFTGLNKNGHGHGQLLVEAKKRGIEDFVICSPNKKETLDNNRNMFTLQQKVEIAKEGCKDIGFNILDAFISRTTNVLPTLVNIAEKFDNRRIVLICGPDRIDNYTNMGLIPYSKGNNPAGAETQFELFGVADRDASDVSGTRVREAIRNNDKERFLNMTGYSEKMWNLCRGMAEKNGVLTESMNEALEATKRQGIYHLYNPGNAMEYPQAKFLDFVKYLDSLGTLVNGKNFSIREKPDGAAFRMGIDDEGKFFIEQSYSGPIYDSQWIRDKYSKDTGKPNRLGRGWANLMDKLKSDSKTQKVLRSIYEKSGAFKVMAEIFITELGYGEGEGLLTFVASRYHRDRIGKDATIIMYDVLGADGQSLENSKQIMNTLIKDASSSSVKYDNNEMVAGQDIIINIKPTLATIKRNITQIRNEYGDIETILSGTSRKRDDIQLRKNVKGLIEEQQGLLNSVFEEKLEKYQGKWGPDYEGVILEFKNGTLLKITSKKFKEFKASHDDKVQKWLKDEMDESYESYLIKSANFILESFN